MELIKKLIELENQPRQHIGVSDAVQCHRKVYRRFTQQDTISSPQMTMGSALHKYFEKLITAHPEALKDQGVINIMPERAIHLPGPDLYHAGTADLILQDQDGYIIIDFKTTGRYTIDDPDEQHIDQVSLYAKLFSDNPSTRVAILYYNRDTGREWYFEQPYDPERGKALYKRFLNLRKQVKDGTEPERKYTEPAKECEFCDYKNSCWLPKELYEKFEKSAETVIISDDIENQIVELDHAVKEYQEKLADAKAALEFALGGKKGKGKCISATYVPMKEGTRLDTKALENDMDLSKYQVASYRKGYYSYKIKEENHE